jgi:hypothetical protein
LLLPFVLEVTLPKDSIKLIAAAVRPGRLFAQGLYLLNCYLFFFITFAAAVHPGRLFAQGFYLFN